MTMRGRWGFAALALLSLGGLLSARAEFAAAGHVPGVTRNVVCSPTLAHVAAGGGQGRVLSLQNVGTLHVNIGWQTPGLTTLQGWTLHAGGAITFVDQQAGLLCQTRPGTGETTVEVLESDGRGVFTSPGVVSLSGGSVAVTGVAHISSVTHIAGAVQQAGTWNVNHIAAVQHVALAGGLAGATNRLCHSQAAFSLTAGSIVAHGASGQQLYICGLVLTAASYNGVSVVEGTGAACVTNPAALLGSTVGTVGLALGGTTNPAPFVAVSDRPWITTRVAGNQLCVLPGATSHRVSGVVIYGAY